MMSRRQFIASSAAAATVAALPIPATATIGVDMAAGPDQTMIYMSTPQGDLSWVYELMARTREDVNRATGVSWGILGGTADEHD